MQTMVGPFLAAFDEDVDIETAKDAQVYIGKGTLSKEQISTVVHKERKAFIFSKPQLDKMDGACHCTVQLFAEEDATHFGGRRNCRNRLGSLLWVKAKSPEAINDLMKHDLEPSTASDCAAGINMIIYQKALEMVSPRARERFMNLGRPLRFVPDYQAKSGLNWVNTRVRYTMGEDGYLEVCCPSLHTGLDTLPRYAGMQYVKVFSLALMIEYILVDAFSSIEGLGYVDR